MTADFGPFATFGISLTGAQDIDDSCQNALWIGSSETCGFRHRAGLETFTATGAGIGNGQSARFEASLEIRLLIHWVSLLLTPVYRGLECNVPVV